MRQVNRNKLLGGVILLFFLSCNPGTRNSDWPVYLGDKAVSHYSSLKQINTANVSQLKVAWIYHTNDVSASDHSQIQCNPIEIDGVLYATSPMLKLFALNAATGRQLWKFDPFSDTSSTKARINVNRGVTFWTDGKNKSIYYVAGYFLYAINANTGKPVNTFGKDGKVDLRDGLDRDVKDLYITATSPGIIYKDLLIIGSRVAEEDGAAPGHIRAYDVLTGKRRWIFHTIPYPGEQGYETWESKTAWKYAGGANSWAGMSLDEQRGIVYVPTGSATYDFYGGHRKGKNLFSDCVLALDAANGKLKWYYQTVHHDLWDRDLPAPPNLVTIHQDGRTTDAIAQVTKTGYIFVLNRDNGTPIFSIKDRSVPVSTPLAGEQPWPTQPNPLRPEPFVSQTFTAADINPLVPKSSQKIVSEKLAQLQTGKIFLPPSEQGTIIFPGFDGGAEWGGAAYDAESNLLYVNANQIPWILTMIKKLQENETEKKTIAGYGKLVYDNHCMACHGANREGSGDYPSLQKINKKLESNDILQIINNGRRMMPSFKQLSKEDKSAVIAYLLNLKTGKSFDAKTDDKLNNTDGLNPQSPYTMTGYIKFRTPEGYPASKPPWGTLSAIDLNTGKVVWQIPLGDYPQLHKKGEAATGTENYGGPVVTAGGLIFIAATPDRKLRAFDKASGKLLWETTLPAAGFATPATYQFNGKQYVVIACGGGKLDAPSGDSYVAFALPD